MANVIYLAGLPRSGTNYVQWLLKENFKNIIVVVIWKHYAPKDLINKINWSDKNQDISALSKEIKDFSDDVAIRKKGSLPPNAFVSSEIKPPGVKESSNEIAEEVKKAILNKTVRFLINVKNPYSWHLSYSKHWKKHKFPDHMSAWNSLNGGWFDFYNNNPDITIFTRYEDMLRNFKSELDKIKDAFKLVPRNQEYVNVTGLLTTTTDCYKDEEFKRRSYFLNEEYAEELFKNKDNIETCRNILSKDLVEYFGYKIL